jgi:hypothetical protein
MEVDINHYLDWDRRPAKKDWYSLRDVIRMAFERDRRSIQTWTNIKNGSLQPLPVHLNHPHCIFDSVVDKASEFLPAFPEAARHVSPKQRSAR